MSQQNLWQFEKFPSLIFSLFCRYWTSVSWWRHIQCGGHFRVAIFRTRCLAVFVFFFGFAAVVYTGPLWIPNFEPIWLPCLNKVSLLLLLLLNHYINNTSKTMRCSQSILRLENGNTKLLFLSFSHRVICDDMEAAF